VPDHADKEADSTGRSLNCRRPTLHLVFCPHLPVRYNVTSSLRPECDGRCVHGLGKDSRQDDAPAQPSSAKCICWHKLAYRITATRGKHVRGRSVHGSTPKNTPIPLHGSKAPCTYRQHEPRMHGPELKISRQTVRQLRADTCQTEKPNRRSPRTAKLNI
jgi:hypothetical protein